MKLHVKQKLLCSSLSTRFKDKYQQLARQIPKVWARSECFFLLSWHYFSTVSCFCSTHQKTARRKITKMARHGICNLNLHTTHILAMFFSYTSLTNLSVMIIVSIPLAETMRHVLNVHFSTTVIVAYTAAAGGSSHSKHFTTKCIYKNDSRSFLIDATLGLNNKLYFTIHAHGYTNLKLHKSMT